MKDRLSIEKKYESMVVDKIDDLKFLGLDKGTVDRLDLFMFAVALGVKKGERTPLSNKHGWVRMEYVKNQTELMAEIRALWIKEAIKTNQEDKLDDMDEAITVAEEYANTGFRVLNDYLNQKTIPNVYSFIKELDERYKVITGNPT